MRNLNRPKGTQDIYNERSLIYQEINNIFQNILRRNNFQPIIFPTYEYEELFLSSLEKTTDVVHKEMFCFLDRKERRMVLRPEGTVCVARAVLQNRLFSSGQPLKLYYWSNMFRYERPQKGRYREFWQLGVEMIGCSGVIADYELLWLIKELFVALHIKDFKLEINYLGKEETKTRYKELLRSFCLSNNLKLCSDCQRKIKNNPLRIVDCKICSFNFSFPAYEVVFSEEDRSYLRRIENLLENGNVEFEFNYHLVRGLDYYTGLVWEVRIGEENSFLGGGRYDNLYEKIGAIDLPSAGFAIGIDRLVNYCEEKQILRTKNGLDLFLIANREGDYKKILEWTPILRKKCSVEYNLKLNKKISIGKIISSYKPKLIVSIEKNSKILFLDCNKGERSFFNGWEEVIRKIDVFLNKE
jgi:histidyl-tRNA synthetase